MADLDLLSLLSAIGGAIKDAQRTLETVHLEHYLQHFEQKEDDAGPFLQPKTIRLAVPQPNGENRMMEVPLVALVRHHALSLEQVTVRLAVGADVDKGTGRIRATLGPAPKPPPEDADGKAAPQSRQEIELVFKRDDTPEGLARLSDEAVKLI